MDSVIHRNPEIPNVLNRDCWIDAELVTITEAEAWFLGSCSCSGEERRGA